jgi:hypothetical protein
MVALNFDDRNISFGVCAIIPFVVLINQQDLPPQIEISELR